VSNTEAAPDELSCGASPFAGVLHPREVPLGGPRAIRVRRTLPQRERSLIGAWCFVDHYGPHDLSTGPGMDVPPHPHTGLQTVSWLFSGEVEHRDSAGIHATIRPGELNLMTAGAGICHSEVSVAGSTSATQILHGAQLWVALPDADRDTAPAFEHHAYLPVLTAPGLRVTVIMGELDGAVSPGTAYSPLVGADLELTGGTDVTLPLEPDFEYAVMTMSGAAEVDDVGLEPGSLLYLGCGRSALRVRAKSDAGLMLLGGEPFDEKIVMWWNLIGRTGQEIAEARADWAAGECFGTVEGYDGVRLDAPTLPPTPLKPRGRTR
jgi:redox-sensitive bicupin YhaK (pirin superfamily)